MFSVKAAVRFVVISLMARCIGSKRCRYPVKPCYPCCAAKRLGAADFVTTILSTIYIVVHSVPDEILGFCVPVFAIVIPGMDFFSALSVTECANGKEIDSLHTYLVRPRSFRSPA